MNGDPEDEQALEVDQPNPYQGGEVQDDKDD